MKAKKVYEALGDILKPVSGDEIRKKFKKSVDKIYSDFDEKSQLLLNVMCDNNFYASMLNEIGDNIEFDQDEPDEPEFMGPDDFEREELDREMEDVLRVAGISSAEPEHAVPQQTSEKNTQKLENVTRAFDDLMYNLNLWDKDIKTCQETIKNYITGMKYLHKYKGWDTRRRFDRGLF